MSTFALPAGCRMYITASMERDAGARHSWTVRLLEAGTGADAEPRASYGSRIARDESQRIDAPAVKADCVCEVLSTHEADGGWAPDIGVVSVRTPDDLSIRFQQPTRAGDPETVSECVLSFQFSPAIPA
jgi:hypothetical protein